MSPDFNQVLKSISFLLKGLNKWLIKCPMIKQLANERSQNLDNQFFFFKRNSKT